MRKTKIIFWLIISLFIVAISLKAGLAKQDYEVIKSNGAEIKVYNGTNITFDYDKKTNIVTATGNISKATITIPHDKLSKIGKGVKLFKRQNKIDKFSLAEPYCKNITEEIKTNKKEKVCDDMLCIKSHNVTKITTEYKTKKDIDNCFNTLLITNKDYIFNVEHFTDYYVNLTGGNYTTLEGCLDAINNTEDKCVLLQDDYSETFSGAKDYSLGVPGNTDWNIDFANRKNVTIDFSNSIIRRQGTWEGMIFAYVGGHNTIKNLIGTTQPGSVLNKFIQTDNSGSNDYNETIYDNLIVYGDVQSAIHLGGTGFGRQSLINSNISCISDECFRPYGEINITNSIISGGSAIKEFTGSVTIDNSSFINGARLILTDPTTDGSIVNSYFTDRIQNNNYYGSMNITNNTFVNIIEYNALDLSFIGATNSNNNNVINNTFINCGNDTYGSALKISNTTYNYLGEDFNDYTPLMLKSDIATSVTITTADTDVSAMTNGTANFSLWLLSLPGLGIGNTTFYVEQPYLMDCAAVAGAYGGICYNYTDDYLIGNGATSNYTIRDVSPDITIVAGTQDPAYLRFVNITIHNHFAINLSDAQRTNITGNTFKGCTDCSPIGYTNGGTSYEVAVWLNNFYVKSPYDSDGVIVDYCVDGYGNFYEKSLTPMDGDCGQANFTNPITLSSFNSIANGSILFNWTNQSTNLNDSFYVLMYNGTENLLTNTSNLFFNWTMTHEPYGNYTFRVMPNQEGINGTAYDIVLTLIGCDKTCFVNSTGGDYVELKDCLYVHNNTLNKTCILNEGNRIYNISDYHLIYNLSGGNYQDTKINITANNMILDCNDSAIIGQDGINIGFGIYSVNINNVTIKNCNVSGYNYDFYNTGATSSNITITNFNSSCTDEAIHFDLGTDINMTDVNIIKGKTACIYGINIGGKRYTIKNTIIKNAAQGIVASSISNSTIRNMSFINSSVADMRLSGNSISNQIYYNNFSGLTDCILFQNLVGSAVSFNNITENEFNCKGKSINITRTEQTNNTIWFNNFYNGTVYDSGTNQSFCFNGEGNFYEEHLPPPNQDCGLVNITTPSPNLNYSNFINLIWTRQSSKKTINYSTYYSNDNATWNQVSNNKNLTYLWSITIPSGSYYMKIMPNDGVKNGTWQSIPFYVLWGATWGTGATSAPETAVTKKGKVFIIIEPFGTELNPLLKNYQDVNIYIKDENCTPIDTNLTASIMKDNQEMMILSTKSVSTGVYNAKIDMSGLSGLNSIEVKALNESTSSHFSISALPTDDPLFIVFIIAIILDVILFIMGLIMFFMRKSMIPFVIFIMLSIILAFFAVNHFMQTKQTDYSKVCSPDELNQSNSTEPFELPILFDSFGNIKIWNAMIIAVISLISFFTILISFRLSRPKK